MRSKNKASLVLCAATAVAGSLLHTRSARAGLVVDFEGNSYTSGANWTSNVPVTTGGSDNLVGITAGGNTQVANAFGTNAGVQIGSGFTVPTALNTPPGGLTSYTIASVFDPTAAKTTGNFVYQAASIYGFDIAGAAMPDTGLGFGGTTGLSVVAGVGTLSGDTSIVSRAIPSAGTIASAVFQVNDPGGAAGVGTATLYVNGNIVTQVTGLTIAPIDPSRAAGNFGLGGQFAGGAFPGLLGSVQVYSDTSMDGAALSQSLLTSNGGSYIPIKQFTWTGTVGLYTAKTWSQGNSIPNDPNYADARISNGGTVNITSAITIPLNALDFYIGDAGSGTGFGNLNQTAGTLNITNSFYIGRNNASGTYNLGGGTLNFQGFQNFVLVGNTSTPAIMNILGTGVLAVATNAGGVLVGEGTINASGGTTAASAILNISGSGSLNTSSSVIYVGDNTAGSLGVLNVSGGTIYAGNTLAIGRSGGTGILNLSGTGVITKNNGSGGTINIGGLNSSSGTFNQTGGSLVSLTSATNIGEANGTGTWNMSAGSANLQTLNVGDNGTGTLTTGGSAALTATTTNIGNNQFSNGTLNLSTTQALPTINIGVNGTGVLNQTGTAVVNSTVSLGQNALGVGTWNLLGTTATVPTLTVGTNGTGTVNLSGAAALTASTVTVAANATGKGVLNIGSGTLTTGSITRGTGTSASLVLNGGTIVATNNSSSFISGFNAGEMTLQSGGGKINTQAFNVTLNSSFAGTGSLTKLGTGTLLIGPNSASTYTGTTNVAAGTLKIAYNVYNNNLRSNVSAYYAFNNSSTLLNDASPNGNNLIDEFGPPFGPGATFSTSAPPGLSGSVSLPNNLVNKDYLTTGDGTAPATFPMGNSSYTVAGWINLDGTNVSANGILGYGNYGTNRTVIALRTANSNAAANLVSPDGVDNYWWGADLTAPVPNSQAAGSLVNNWNYVAVTYDATTDLRTIYLNNAAIGSDTPGVNNASNQSFAIGRTNSAASAANEFFSGNMTDLLVTTTALAPSQLAQAAAANISFGSYTFQGTLPAGPIAIAGGATLDLNGSTQTIGSLQNYNGTGGTVTNTNAGFPSTLTLVPATGTSTFSGTINDGAGGISLIVSGTGTQVLGGINNYSGGTTVTSGTLEIGGAGSLSPTGAVNVSGGVLTFDASSGTGIRNLATGALTISSTGTVTLAIASVKTTRSLLAPASLSIAAGGKLDLGNNDLDIPNGNLASVFGLLQTGYNNGNWNGSGISSAAAATDSRHLTALGSILNNGLYGSGTALGLFDGANPAASDVLVKYTYYGDTNLDGKVDGSDYSRIDNGFATGLSGWYNGDFNYDGVINGSDYTLIDNAFNSQGASLADSIVSPTAAIAAQIAGGSSAVPEPATLSLLTIGAAGLLGRRRRSH